MTARLVLGNSKLVQLHAGVLPPTARILTGGQYITPGVVAREPADLVHRRDVAVQQVEQLPHPYIRLLSNHVFGAALKTVCFVYCHLPTQSLRVARRIDLRRRGLSVSDIVFIAGMLRNNGTCKDLDMRENMALGSTAQELAMLLSHNRGLETLRLEGIDASGADDIAIGLRGNTTLTCLHMEPGSAVGLAIQHLRGCVDASGNPPLPQGLTYRLRNRHLTPAEAVVMCRLLPLSGLVTAVSLVSTNLGEESAECLGAMIAASPNLKSLILTDNRLGSRQACQALATGLASSRVTRLNLASNCITEEAGIQLAPIVEHCNTCVGRRHSVLCCWVLDSSSSSPLHAQQVRGVGLGRQPRTHGSSG